MNYSGGRQMKKLKNEKKMVKKAIALGVEYGEKRGAVEFEATDSAHEKLAYIYRLLLHDKLISPIPEIDISQKAIRHKLAMWASRQNDGVKPLLDAFLKSQGQ